MSFACLSIAGFPMPWTVLGRQWGLNKILEWMNMCIYVLLGARAPPCFMNFYWRIDAFELWCWRRLFRLPWTARRSNQSIQKEINPEYSLEGLMLKLKLQYFGYSNTLCEELTHWERPWCWERLKVGGEGDDRGRDGWMISPTQWTWVWISSRSWWWTGKPDLWHPWGSKELDKT